MLLCLIEKKPTSTISLDVLETNVVDFGPGFITSEILDTYFTSVVPSSVLCTVDFSFADKY